MNTAEQLKDHFNYADYCQWLDNERWELINGISYAMNTPLRIHQEILFELGGQVGNYLQGKSCKGYMAPFDVCLPQQNEADDQIDTVVQPDLLVVCDHSKLDKKGCRGAPDWIVGVLSPSTAIKDMSTKRMLYQQHGVREYWIIHPSEQWVMIYCLNSDGEYELPSVIALEGNISVSIFKDLQIDWDFLEHVI